jgi:hypothetical protein
MPRITAAEAERRIVQYLKDKTGRNRRVPSINELIQEVLHRTVHVFNAGPWAYRENGGSFGYMFIPACEVGAPMEWERLKSPNVPPGVYVPDHWEEGEKKVTDPHTQYAAAKPLPGLMAEPLPKEIDECVWNLQDTGEYFADEVLLKIGIAHSFQHSNARKGVFRAAGKTPTEAELKKARHTLENDFMPEMILEADRAWAAGPQRAEQIIRPEIHHVCAHWLNLDDRDWLRGTKPQGRTKCEMCGLMVDVGVATCTNGHIVDAEAYRRAHAQQEAIKKSLAVS